MYRRARESLSGGVASSYQLRDPWPIYLTTGEGPVVYDVDGNRMWDFHNGFGSMVQGHANPAIVQGGQRPRRRGHALRGDDRGRRRRRRGAPAALGTRALAVRQLGIRGDDGRDPDRARPDRPRHDRQDLRLLSRPSRRRDGVDRRRVRQHRRPRELRVAALRRRHSEGRRAISRSRCRSTTPARWSAGSRSSRPRAASPPA